MPLQDNIKDEEEQSLDSDAIAGLNSAQRLEKVLDMKGRPYTAADEYAARFAQSLNQCELVLPCFIFFPNHFFMI